MAPVAEGVWQELDSQAMLLASGIHSSHARKAAAGRLLQEVAALRNAQGSDRLSQGARSVPRRQTGSGDERAAEIQELRAQLAAQDARLRERRRDLLEAQQEAEVERRRCDLAESIPRLQVPSEQCSATGTSRSTDDFDNEESCCAHSEELIGLEAEERLLRSRHERLLEEYLQANRKAGELQDGCDSASAEFALVDAANKSLAKESEECDAQLAGAADDLGALEARIARCEVRTSASLPEKLACLRAEASRLHQAIARPFCGTQAQAGFVASEAVQSATSKRRLNTIDSLSLRLDLSATNSMQ